jgi:4-amino-4-deoxy-L-arabinose transferase-like glycosyltransferase
MNDHGVPDGWDRVLPATARGRWAVVCVLGVALVLRLGVVATIRDTYVPVNDAQQFDTMATSLAHGDGFGNTELPGAKGPTAFRGPVYPVVLSSLYVVVGGHRWTWGLVQNALIGTAVVAMIGVLGSQVFGRRAGVAAMIAAALHPTLILFGSSLQLEPLLVFLELATLAAAFQHRRRPERIRYALVAGVLLGCVVLTREIGLWLVPPVALLLWGAPSRWSVRALRAPALALAVAVAVVAPWTIRNAMRFGEFVPVSTSSGAALAGTYNGTAFANKDNPGLWIPPWFDPQLADRMRAVPGRDEAYMDRLFRSGAVEFAREHPGYVPKIMVWNTVRLFDLAGPRDALFIRQFIPYPERLTRLSVYASYIVYVVAAVGATRRLARRAPMALWIFPFLVWLNLALLAGNIRYRASIEPFLLLLVGVAVMSWWPRGADRQAAAVQS